MTDGHDCRRQYIRFPTDALVWWSRDWDAEPIALLDISAGGMLCEFPSSLEVDSKVSLHFEFPTLENMIFCHVKVVHCRPMENRLYHVGLKILELEGMDQMEFVNKVKDGILKKSNSSQQKAPE